MSKILTIETERLKLRPFTLEDAPKVQRLLGEWDVASTKGRIPHPYLDGMAEEWISTHQERLDRDEGVTLAITHNEEECLIGAISLITNKEFENASLGYWIGKPYWNNGYCTEADQAMVKYGFEILKLNRIHATHMTRNPASGRVMQKIVIKHEGSLRQHVKRWGKFEDMEAYGILRSEYAGPND